MKKYAYYLCFSLFVGAIAWAVLVKGEAVLAAILCLAAVWILDPAESGAVSSDTKLEELQEEISSLKNKVNLRWGKQ